MQSRYMAKIYKNEQKNQKLGGFSKDNNEALVAVK